MIGLYWKAAAAVLMAAVLVLSLNGKGKEMGVLLILSVCCMLGIAVLEFLEPVMAFLYELESAASLDGTILKSLLQLVGIGLVAELASLVCSDAGCGSLGKGLQILSSAAILWLSLPLYRTLIALVRDIMGKL